MLRESVCRAHHGPEDIQGARRVVPDQRHTRGGGRVPHGAGQKGTGPVADVAGGRCHREHDDLRPTQRRGAGGRVRGDQLQLRSGAVAVARRRAAHRRSPLHEILLGHQEQRGPAAV